MTAPSAYLAIDLGASSGRAVVGTLDGDRMRMDEVHRFRTPLVEEAGHLYWDVEALLTEVRISLNYAANTTPHLRSVSIDSWAVDYVPLDADGRPLRRPYSYRDPRTKGRLEQVASRFGADALYSATGVQFLPFNTLPQIVADLADEPDLVARTTTRLLIADYLLYRLSGQMFAERTMASTTQLYDVRAGDWARSVIEFVGDDPTRWPRLVAPGTVIGAVAAEWWSGPGERPTVIATCSHDTAAAVAAVPATGGEPWAYISSGTWSLVGGELSRPVVTSAARRAGFTNEVGLDGTIRFLKNRTGTWILEECAREWLDSGEVVPWELLMREAAPVQSPGFTIDCNQPAFGERGAMVGAIRRACAAIGAPVPETRGGLVRLVLESLADSYRSTLDELAALTGVEIEIVHVVGGGARNAILNQLTADACGRRVLAGPVEATALGNLLLQARTLGHLPNGVSIREAARHSTDVIEYTPGRAVARSAPILSVL
ncbi:MAG: rhamnulokinase family protein [Gemmatimonadaceae bacterium]